MTIFEVVHNEVTAKQAAQLYGLKFDRAGRGFCPWHEDGRHAALQFFPDGGCYCHSCHAYGDAVEITSQMLGITPMRAAWQIYRDFKLNQPVDQRDSPETKRKMQQEREKREAKAKVYSRLCEIVREADGRLAKYTPETADAEFALLLDARNRADQKINLLLEDMKRERS